VNDFYVPALSAAVQYDRAAGFFSSSALAVAGTGLARLIQNRGKMRLLVGAELSEEDVRAIEGGEKLARVVERRMLADFGEIADTIARNRLGALAWMVREGLLEVRVVLPKGQGGRPLSVNESIDYFHTKKGGGDSDRGSQETNGPAGRDDTDVVRYKGVSREPGAVHPLPPQTHGLVPNCWQSPGP